MTDQHHHEIDDLLSKIERKRYKKENNTDDLSCLWGKGAQANNNVRLNILKVVIKVQSVIVANF